MSYNIQMDIPKNEAKNTSNSLISDKRLDTIEQKIDIIMENQNK